MSTTGEIDGRGLALLSLGEGLISGALKEWIEDAPARQAEYVQYIGRRREFQKNRYIDFERIRAAMERISWNRWLLPWELGRIQVRLVRCISGSPSVTINALERHGYIDSTCSVVGMLRGHPPIYPWDRRYPALVELVGKLRRRPAKHMNEVALLQLLGKKRG